VLAELQQQMVAGAWRVLHMHCSLLSLMACSPLPSPGLLLQRWNSVWMQLSAVICLDQQKLSDLLKSTAHENLIFSPRESQQLREVVDVLAPFAELTNICQRDKCVTISCVVPGLMNLMLQLKEC